MNTIEELIQKECPEGVEYLPLGDLGTFERGKNIQKTDFVEDGFPCIHYGQIYTYYKLFTDKTIKFVPFELASKATKAHPLDVIITLTSENIEDVCTPLAWLGTTDVAISGHSAAFHHNQDAKYITYCIKSSFFFQQKKKLARGAKVIEIKPEELAKIEIPVPPLSVQHKIVEILDKFTSLEAELQAELEARKKQYEYYRNQLLDFTGREDVEWKTLDSFLKIMNGKDYKTLGTGTIPVYGTGGVMTYVDQFAYDKPSVLLPRKGSIDKIYYVDEPFWTVDTIYWTKISLDIIVPKYFYYCMTRVNLASKNIGTGAIPSLTQSILYKIVIPIPPLTEQQRIVTILDKFEALINDQTASLAAEMKARHQQYEYYRDKLLTFQRKEA